MEFDFYPNSKLVPAPKPELFTVSNSQIGVWGNCQMRWKYTYLDQLVPKQAQMGYQLGILFHELTAKADQFVMHGYPAGDPLVWESTMRKAEEMFETEEGQQHLMDNMQMYHTAINATKRYILEHTRNQDLGVQIIGVEDHFEVELKTPTGRPYRLHGYTDRVYMEGGKFWILDRKTSRTGQHYKDDQMLLDPQLLLYSAAYREMGYKPFGIAIDSVSTYPYKDYLAEPINKVMKRLRSYRNDRELDFALHHYGEVVDVILKQVESGKPFIRNLSRDCYRCPYSEICLYDMKGIDTEFLIGANYMHREDRQERRDAEFADSQLRKGGTTS